MFNSSKFYFKLMALTKMLTNDLIIFLVLLSLLSSNISGLNSDDFCKLSGKECSQKNAPHVYPCGKNICTRNNKACKEYLSKQEVLHETQLNEAIRIALTSPLRNYNEIRTFVNLRRKGEQFRSLKSKIKNCTQKPYQWRPSEVCVRERNCFQRPAEASGKNNAERKSSKRTNCPCPEYSSYVCGIQRNYCAANKEACDSFSYTKKYVNSTGRIQLLSIEKCDILLATR